MRAKPKRPSLTLSTVKVRELSDTNQLKKVKGGLLKDACIPRPCALTNKR